MKKQEILNNLEKLTPRRAWTQAVLSDAVDLVQNLDCSEVPNSWAELRALSQSAILIRESARL